MIEKVRRPASVALIMAMLVSLLWSHPAWAQAENTPRLDSDRVFSELGILLLHVEDGGPADAAGLESGDVVLAINGVPVEKIVPMLRLMSGIDPGDLLRVIVRSGDDVKIVQLTVGSRGHGRAWLGVLPMPIFGQRTTIAEIANAQVQDPSTVPTVSADQPVSPLCTTIEVTGLAVVNVVAGGPAALAGITPGDTIVSVNGTRDNVEADLVSLLETASPSDAVDIGIVTPDIEGGFGFVEREVTLILEQHPEENRPYYGLRVGPASIGTFTDCTEVGEKGPVTLPTSAQPVPTVEPPAGMENCVYSQTWGFGVTEVLPNSPADAAGLAANDAIVMIDGVEIPEAIQAESLLAGYAAGDEVVLRIISSAQPSADPGMYGDHEVTVVLGVHPQDESRAFLGIMGVPVIMGDSMTCSGTAEAEPIAAEDAASAGESGKDSNVPKTQTEQIKPTLEISGTVIITSAMISAPETTSDTGLWLFCPLEEGIFRCQYPADLDAPIVLEPADTLVLPLAPEGISGGSILPGMEITSTEVITPVDTAPIETAPIETAPIEMFPLPEQPLFYCWTGEGFELCPPMMPMGPVAPGPSTDPGNK